MDGLVQVYGERAVLRLPLHCSVVLVVGVGGSFLNGQSYDCPSIAASLASASAASAGLERAVLRLPLHCSAGQLGVLLQLEPENGQSYDCPSIAAGAR